jgi:hypothetical protein
MPSYRIHRLREAQRQQLNSSRTVPWAASGTVQLRVRDYEEAGEIVAANEYHAWHILRETGQPLKIGDLLQAGQGELKICKYVGFEAAQWLLPETKVPESSHPGGAPESQRIPSE